MFGFCKETEPYHLTLGGCNVKQVTQNNLVFASKDKRGKHVGYKHSLQGFVYTICAVTYNQCCFCFKDKMFTSLLMQIHNVNGKCCYKRILWLLQAIGHC